MQCSNNLKNLSLALLEYERTSGSYPPMNSSPLGKLVSWRVEVLPWLGHQELNERYDRNSDWDAAANRQLANNKVDSFACPSNLEATDGDGRWYSAYVRLEGAKVRAAQGGKLDLSRAHSIAIVEACGQNIIWTEPRDSIVNDATVGVNLPGKKMGWSDGAISSYHTGGANVAMLDGSVRFIPAQIDRKVLVPMLEGVRDDEVESLIEE